MSDKTDVRSLETHGKQLSAETTIALKQPVAKPMPEKGEPAADGFIRSAGSWKGLVDSETLIAVIYTPRRT
jgi:hypothetical protein